MFHLSADIEVGRGDACANGVIRGVVSHITCLNGHIM